MFKLQKTIQITTLSNQKVFHLDENTYSFNEVENKFWPKTITIGTHSVQLSNRSDDVYFKASELEGMFIRFKTDEWFLGKDGSLVEKVEDIVFI